MNKSAKKAIRNVFQLWQLPWGVVPDCPLDVDRPARIAAKQEAQQRIVPMILPEGLTYEIKVQRRGPDERLGGVESNRW